MQWVQNVDGKKIRYLMNVVMGYTFLLHFICDYACDIKLNNLIYFIIFLWTEYLLM